MNLLKKLLVAAGALLAIGSANAITSSPSSCDASTPCSIGTYDLVLNFDKNFTDYFSFNLASNSEVFGFASSFVNMKFDSLTLTKDGGASWNINTFGGLGAVADEWLTAGSYHLAVQGHTLDGKDSPSAYKLGMSVAAVPEPGEWAMMLAGLGMVGVISRRRSRKV